ncbi:MAG: ice-binding family protein [Gallionellaceae bacterium]|nr:ice-binding family protein [Gallionellaceae bacterium]
MAFLLVAFVAGCGGGGGGGGAVPLSSTKAITAYSLAGVTGTVNETAKTIAVTMPSGTNVTALVATFTTTGASVAVTATPQSSGTTPNDFTSPVTYTVTAADATTATYIVTVTVAPASAKAITAYSLAGVAGTINETAKTIAVTMPFGTNVTALVATFTSTGAGVPTVGGVNQVSGTTPNDFTTSKAYIVTAADTTTATYTVTVTVAASSAKAITAYSLAGVAGAIDQTAKTIAVSMPSGTDVTALVATFTTTGASVKIGAAIQVSGTTANNFTTPKAYIVTAADASTVTYTVTVSLAAGPPAVNLLSISTNNFVILATSMITEAAPVNGAITGNIGVSPAAGSTILVACTEMLTGKIYQVDDAYADAACSMSGTVSAGVNKTLVDQAVLDMGTAYTAASDPATPAGVGASNLDLLGGNIPAGTNFTPGVYTWGSNVNINGNITLTGGASDVWIFQMSGNLAIASCGSCASAADGAAIKVILSGGALASNVFWQVGGATTTLGTYSTFNGNILTAPAGLIAIQTGAILHGRALSGTSVALDGNAVGP